MANALGERIANELGIPVYLYERAARRPERQNLADVRRGEFEGIRDTIQAVSYTHLPGRTSVTWKTRV